MNELQRILAQSGPRFLNISYPVPRDYQKSLAEVRRKGLKLDPLDFWKIPLRHRHHTADVESIYHLSRQCDGSEGIVAQHLMQPTEDVFEVSLALLSLEELRLQASNSMGELYRRAEEVGLMECPYPILPIMSLQGCILPSRGAIVFATHPVPNDQRGDFLYCLANHGEAGTCHGFQTVYGDPNCQIAEIAVEWGIHIASYTKEYADGEFTGLKKKKDYQTERPYHPGEVFSWRFAFTLPKGFRISSDQLEARSGALGHSRSLELTA